MAQYASYHQTTETRNGESRTVEEVLVDNVLKRRVFENDALVHESERPFTGRRFAAIAPQRMVALRRALNSSTAGVGVLRRYNDRRIGEVLLERAATAGWWSGLPCTATKLKTAYGSTYRCGDDETPTGLAGVCASTTRERPCTGAGLRGPARGRPWKRSVRGRRHDAVLRLRPGKLTLDECYGRAFVLHEGEDDLGLGGGREAGPPGTPEGGMRTPWWGGSERTKKR